MTCDDEEPPKVGERILCRHPFSEHKRVLVRVSKVEDILRLVIDDGKRVGPPCTLAEARNRALSQRESARPDHMRILNPTPYKVSVSEKLYARLHELWLAACPVVEL